ncbi:MAG: serine/threonine protein kinase [Deltaproteobacteria bacterium]|nr:serine/threonine protein kinase [Deltaproteobacteria bacterium]
MSAGLAGLPASVGRYTLIRVLGHGGMGRVVLALDQVLRRQVALKLVEPASVSEEAQAELRFLFHREARATAALRHPGIVEVYDYSGPDAAQGYLACEYLDGPTLRMVLDERGKLPVAVAAAIAYELAGALGHAHARGVIHRDLKPENVFWTATGRVVLADFGIAKALDGKPGLGNTVVYHGTNVYGSPAYMAPEQLEGGAVGPAVDLHALGAVTYELVTGVQAFDGEDVDVILKAISADSRPSFTGMLAAPEAFGSLVDRLLAKDVAARPSAADDVTRSLRRVLDELGVADPRLLLARDRNLTAAVSSAPSKTAAPASTAAPRIDAPVGVAASAVAGRLPSRLGPSALLTAVLSAALGVAAYWAADLRRAPAPEKPDPSAVATAAPRRTEVDVVIVFSGQGAVSVDGLRMATGVDGARLRLPVGRHTLVVATAAGLSSLDVLLLDGTTPTCVLPAPAVGAK